LGNYRISILIILPVYLAQHADRIRDGRGVAHVAERFGIAQLALLHHLAVKIRALVLAFELMAAIVQCCAFASCCRNRLMGVKLPPFGWAEVARRRLKGGSLPLRKRILHLHVGNTEVLFQMNSKWQAKSHLLRSGAEGVSGDLRRRWKFHAESMVAAGYTEVLVM
jgi:hypothetical protein